MKNLNNIKEELSNLKEVIAKLEVQIKEEELKLAQNSKGVSKECIIIPTCFICKGGCYHDDEPCLSHCQLEVNSDWLKERLGEDVYMECKNCDDMQLDIGNDFIDNALENNAIYNIDTPFDIDDFCTFEYMDRLKLFVRDDIKVIPTKEHCQLVAFNTFNKILDEKDNKSSLIINAYVNSNWYDFIKSTTDIDTQEEEIFNLAKQEGMLYYLDVKIEMEGFSLVDNSNATQSLRISSKDNLVFA
jgi:hypothetical protein